MPAITGQNGRRLVLDLPRVDSLALSTWSFGASLEIDAGSFRSTVADHGDSLIVYLLDLGRSWRGWSGTKHYSSLEGELDLEATHDGLGTVDLRVRLGQPWPPTWSAEATLQIGAGADLERQIEDIAGWANSK